MSENFLETQQVITKGAKIKRFYESNKIFIFSSILILVILFGSLTFYLESKKKEKILLSENYIQAKFYLINGKKNEARFDNTLKFDHYLVEIQCNDDWVDEKLTEAVMTMRGSKLPAASHNCENCQYLKQRWQNYQEVYA